MSLDVTRGGLLVGLAIFGVIAYELRTVAEVLGVNVPLIPYMAGVFVLAGLAVWYVSIKGGWRTETGTDEAA